MSALSPLTGGILLGLSAAAVLVFLGKVAGISRIAGGLLGAPAGDRLRRACFLAGPLAGGALLRALDRTTVQFGLQRSIPTLAVAGLLVGYGTQLGNGCTSGHGVCGMARGSHQLCRGDRDVHGRGDVHGAGVAPAARHLVSPVVAFLAELVFALGLGLYQRRRTNP